MTEEEWEEEQYWLRREEARQEELEYERYLEELAYEEWLSEQQTKENAK